MRFLAKNYAVGPQINFNDIDRMASEGFELIVCNRPDKEDFLQPETGKIKAAIEARGMRFIQIPVGYAPVSRTDLLALKAEFTKGTKIFAYCRSGGRSASVFSALSSL